MNAQRTGLGVTVALHAVALAALLSYAPAREALLAAAPIMVSLIALPKVAQPQPAPPTELPKPRPVAKRVIRPLDPPPVLTAPVEAPAHMVVAPPPPPAPVEPIAPPAPRAPLPITQPVFNADYLDNPAPVYPAPSRRNREEGRVTLRVRVNPRGAVDAIEVRKSSGFERLDQAARDAVRRWKFIPAKRGAEAVAAWVLIPISFRLES